MSDQTQQDADLSLFGDDSTPSDGTVTEPAEGTNNSDQKPQPDLGAINRDRQIKVWSDRIENGEVALTDLPKNLAWMKPFVEEEVTKRVRSRDIDALVEAKLAEKQAKENQLRQAQRFDELKAEAAQLDVDDSTKTLIETSFKRLVAKGLSKADALEEALSTYRVVAKSGDIALQELKKSMKIPTQTRSVESKPEFGSEEFMKSGDSKSRVEEMEKILRQAGR